MNSGRIVNGNPFQRFLRQKSKRQAADNKSIGISGEIAIDERSIRRTERIVKLLGGGNGMAKVTGIVDKGNILQILRRKGFF